MSQGFLRRHFFLLLLGIAVICFYVWWWYGLAGSLRGGVLAWVAERRAAGWTMSTGEPSVSGFPFFVRVTLPIPSIRNLRGDSWQGPPVNIALSPFRPLRPVLYAPGHHLFVLAGQPPLAVTAEEARLDLVLGPSGPTEGTLTVGHASAPDFTLDRAALRVQDLADGPPAFDKPSLGATLDIGGLVSAVLLPGLSKGPASGRVEARLMGVLPPLVFKEALDAWSVAGGTVELDTVIATWPPLNAKGNFTLAFDRALQPLLSGKVTARGVPQVVDGLGFSGVLAPNSASALKAAAAFFSRQGDDGVPELSSPLTIQNRILSLGPAQIVRIPEIVW